MDSIRECSIDGCPKKLMARGWCCNHYELWRRNGAPVKVQKRTPDPERFWRLVQKGDECWDWMGATCHAGYGRFTAYAGATSAHRFSYVAAHGSVPEGLHLDHLCRNRRCVRPEHLEAVTPAENARRAGRHISGRFTHCLHGHPISAENTHTTRDGQRLCAACYRARNKRPRKSRKQTGEAIG